LTWRISAESAVVPGGHQMRTGMAVAGDGHPDHDLRQVVAVVLGLAVGPERRRLAPGRLLRVISDVAVLVPGHRLVLAVQLEVGAGGAGEQQVHLQVEQVRDLVKDLLLHRILDLVQPVHRPVARVIAGGGQAADPGLAATQCHSWFTSHGPPDGPALGQVVEPPADREPAPDRLPR
jgi:hypothetical protein